MSGVSRESPTEHVTVRQFRPADWQALREIRLAALADAPDAFLSSLEREQAFGESDWRKRIERGTSFGAWAGEKPIAMAGCFRDDDPEFAPPDSWQLVGMWVNPQYRGRSVAGRLVDAAARFARSAGARTLTLWVIEGNDSAQAAYERLGLRPTGARQIAKPPDTWELQLGRELTE